MASLNKIELDFSLILCNCMCDQFIYFLFLSRQYQKQRWKKEIEEKVAMRLNL